MKGLIFVCSVLIVAHGFACGGDDDDTGDDGDTGGEVTTAPTAGATPEDQYVVVGNCPAEPTPTGEPNAVVPGVLVVGFGSTTTIEVAQAFLDMYVTDYRIGQNQFEGSRIAFICVAPGTENDVTRLLPLGGDLRFVQRYRISAGF